MRHFISENQTSCYSLSSPPSLGPVMPIGSKKPHRQAPSWPAAGLARRLPPAPAGRRPWGRERLNTGHSLARLPELRACSIFVHAPPSRRRPPNRSSMSRTEAFRSPESRREGLMAKRSRPEMAPQRLEKIESAPGNGRASEASDPQDLVPVHAADRARPQLGAARMRKVAENARRSEIARCRSEIASFFVPSSERHGEFIRLAEPPDVMVVMSRSHHRVAPACAAFGGFSAKKRSGKQLPSCPLLWEGRPMMREQNRITTNQNRRPR